MFVIEITTEFKCFSYCVATFYYCVFNRCCHFDIKIKFGFGNNHYAKVNLRIRTHVPTVPDYKES